MLRVESVGRVAVLAIALSVSTLTFAAGQRSFVSAKGVDNVSCSLTTPCRGFAAAVAVTSAGGEVIVLDSAGYGGVTIDKSISIIAPPGIYAGISVFGIDSGVTINAGNGDTVILEGLSVNGPGTGSIGITIFSAALVQIDRCVITGGFNGIAFLPSATTGVQIRDTTLRNSFQSGIDVQTQLGGRDSSVEVSRSLFQDNGIGISLLALARAAIVDSTMHGNNLAIATTAPNEPTVATLVIDRTEVTGGGAGVNAGTYGSALAVVNISNSVIANNSGAAVSSGNNATIRLMGMQITGNATGVSVSGNGTVASLGNNMVTGNATNGPAATSVTPY